MTYLILYSANIQFLQQMRGQSGHTTRLRVPLSPSFLNMDAMTPQLDVAFASYVGHWWVRHIFSRVIQWCLYNQELTDVRSSGAANYFLYCIKYITSRSLCTARIKFKILWETLLTEINSKCTNTKNKKLFWPFLDKVGAIQEF